ncbi:MAG: bifunctional YncE family protein/alkaline phosphatase family protein [Acidobacteriaceae bacterium]|nr:bifunctional YncE family protein/alkaline phosphatase family protein [Acidobacteriaceae bacterium]MBV9779371.1 bifunctional YncE family protein/alkaline phosphatase family protein [Acidobacteriaceae bacterium]
MRSGIVFAFVLVACLGMREAIPQNAPREQVGSLPGGGFLLNSGWSIRPAGQQVGVDTLPMRAEVSNDGKYLLVLNAGYNPPSVSVIDIAQKREIGRTALPDAWLGLAVSPRGNYIYVGGGSRATVYELLLDPQNGMLTRTREFAAVTDINNKGLSFIGDVAISSDAHLAYAADVHTDSIAVINLQSGRLIARWKCGRRPYCLLLPPGNQQVIVSSWADAAVYQYDANSGAQIGMTRIGSHPTDMVWLNKPPPAEDQTASAYVARLFVAAANTNYVYSVGVTRDGQLKALETINVSLTPMHPLGMTPSSLAIDKQGNRLYVACSDANALGVVDIAGPRSAVLGFIPTGWYPTAVELLADNGLAILNGKGAGSHPNPNGPNPSVRGRGAPNPKIQYVARIQTGTAEFVPAVADEQLSSYSNTVLQNSPYRDDLVYGEITDAQEAHFARTQEHAAPIQHVIYIIKENRTYDQVLGDMEKGNGDKSLNLFGEQVTPNLHQLAREFILYDNFYENSDVSADGHNWAAAAIAPDYTVKLWPNNYAQRRHTYDFEGGEPADTPPAGYIWDNAIEAGITVRGYGEWTINVPRPAANGQRQIAKVNDPALQPYTDMNYRGFDLDYSDLDRTKEFIREWKEFDTKGQVPQLSIVRLGNDHTSGTAPGKLTPFSFAAENDFAVGMLVEAVSHSNVWPSTAIFIIEDDAQNGCDHVDSHRAPAWVISPFTRRGIVDSAMYNQASVLRTMELIVGLRPMTHFDAGARPMFAGFSEQGDNRPFTAIQPKVSLTERNSGRAPGADQSARLDFSDADRADDDTLNSILWRAIKHTEPPPPTRSGFGN